MMADLSGGTGVSLCFLDSLLARGVPRNLRGTAVSLKLSFLFLLGWFRAGWLGYYPKPWKVKLFRLAAA